MLKNHSDILKAVIAGSQVAKKSIVNVSSKESSALTFVSVRGVRTVNKRRHTNLKS